MTPDREALARLKAVARRQVAQAVKYGRLHRPSACSRCGNEPGAGRDGRALVQAHHANYERPLDVEWLCAKCHRIETPLPDQIGGPAYGDRNGMRKYPGLAKGERNNQAKISRADAMLIRSMRGGDRSQNEIARQFGVSKQLVSNIMLGKNWT